MSIPKHVRHLTPFLTIKTFVLPNKVGIIDSHTSTEYVTCDIISNLRKSTQSVQQASPFDNQFSLHANV